MQIAVFYHSLSTKSKAITPSSMKTTERDSNKHQLTS